MLIAQKLDERRMPVSSGCDEHPVPRQGTI